MEAIFESLFCPQIICEILCFCIICLRRKNPSKSKLDENERFTVFKPLERAFFSMIELGAQPMRTVCLFAANPAAAISIHFSPPPHFFLPIEFKNRICIFKV